ncbi:MAG: hypothetical protein KJ941_01135, partial [Bacteroidetes bacterium]|nr:hypothetical protein [Bacteroidota bacterium]
MRNKGFFWFITILLTAICIYQLSFTWVSNSVENKAEREADVRVAELMKQAALTGDSTLLPNGTMVNFKTVEGEELAKAAFINQILREKSDKKVYPVFGSTFSEVKNRSLAFGLDLVGGMSVTMEISIPDLVASFARNQKDLQFVRPFESSKKRFAKEGGDFVAIFADEYKKLNKGQSLVKIFAISEIEELGTNSSDKDVLSFLNDKVSSAMDGVELIMNRRINQFGVAQPNIQKDPSNNRLYIELPGVQDEATVAQKLKSTANLQFFETYMGNEIASNWQQASNISLREEMTEEEMNAEVDSTDVDSTKSTLDQLTKGNNLSKGSI